MLNLNFGRKGLVKRIVIGVSAFFAYYFISRSFFTLRAIGLSSDLEYGYTPKIIRNDTPPAITLKESMSVLFCNEETGQSLDFYKIGYQLRFFKDLHNRIYNAQNNFDVQNTSSDQSYKFSEAYSVDNEWLAVTDSYLFPWISPGFKSTVELHDSFVGKGIVVSVFNDYVPMAMVNLGIIKYILKSNLAIEIFYMGDKDLSPNNRTLLETIPDVKCIDILKVFNNAHLNLVGWAIKPFALLASSFQHAILMDADTVFLQPPEVLFLQPTFLEKGALFFQDRTLFSASGENHQAALRWIEAMTPKPFDPMQENRFILSQSSHQQESGVVVIDKKTRFTGLLAASHLNANEVRGESYKHMYGDKETFWIGFEMVREQYAWNPYIPGSIGSVKEKDGLSEVCSVQILHVDYEMNPLWLNGGLMENKITRDFTISKFEDYILERNEMQQQHASWSVQRSYFCLRTSKGAKKLSAEILDVLKKARPLLEEYYPPKVSTEAENQIIAKKKLDEKKVLLEKIAKPVNAEEIATPKEAGAAAVKESYQDVAVPVAERLAAVDENKRGQ